jgi:serine/threonine-protein kinase PknG
VTACQRAGCTGHYAPDGYCDECGHKAPAALLAAMGSATSGSPGQAQSGQVQSGGVTSAQVVSRSTALGVGTGPVSGASRSTRGRLGANLVAVPPVPRRDPASAVMADPQVPESHRFCGACGEPVGRGRDGQPGRAEGFCPRDRTPFSFKPKLKPGELLERRYEVLGCLAHGGLGWIYLGRDRNISEAGSDRWVVLKGLINTGDPDAAAAAVAERRFLVEVDHPNIVKIHDFAQHVDEAGETTGYIVMEYVGGRSLKDVALHHRGPDGSRAPLPLPQVLAYGIEIMPAIAYLHEHNLLFCDFKPDNVIHTEDQLKLIDLGAVRRIGDDVSALYGTPGYQAPELATAGPSISSDLYTIGRTLAVLSFDFGGFSTRYVDKLPDKTSVPLFVAEESYWRLLNRATNPDPAQRFPSAVDMAEQMTGVLREVLAAADGNARPAVSTNFTPERATFGSDVEIPSGAEIINALPLPMVDLTDPGAGLIATLSATDPAAVASAISGITPRSLELSLRLVRAHLEAGAPAAAAGELALARDAAPGDWRVDWHAGLIGLASADFGAALRAFDAVYDALPGELAAQLAVAICAERSGDQALAARRYKRVWRTDRNFTSAAFGLARTRGSVGDRVGAIAVLDEVPATSSQHTAARVAALRARLSSAIGALTEADFVDANARLTRLGLDAARQARLSVEMFNAALTWLNTAGCGASRLGTLNERDIREGLERSYRLLATLQTDTLARYELVDLANSVRPRTLI